jgi:hypothetical protein
MGGARLVERRWVEGILPNLARLRCFQKEQ